MPFSKSRSLIVGPATVLAPSSGTALTIFSAAASQTLVMTVIANQNAVQISDGTRVGFWGTNAGGSSVFFGASASAGLDIYAGNSPSITITSSGNVTINAPSSGIATTIKGAANVECLNLIGNSTSGQSFGTEVNAGTTSADYCALFTDQADANTFLQIRGDGRLLATKGPLLSTLTSLLTGLNFDAASDTTFTSNAALANDAIVVTVNETGTYEIECFLAFFEATASTGGFQFDFGQGTATISAILFGTDAVGTAVLGLSAATSATTAQSFATIATSSSAPSWSLTKGKVTFSGTGTFGLRTAQNTSSANTTTRKALSYLKLTKTG